MQDNCFQGCDSDGEDQSTRQALGMTNGKVGEDVNAKKWLEGCSGLDDVEKADVIIMLIYELFLTENPENDSAGSEENTKGGRFSTRYVFELIEKVNRFLLPQDRRKLVEVVCQSGHVMLLEMICEREMKDGKYTAWICDKFPWGGKFTGYETLTDLLQYVLGQRCSPQIVLCIAKKVFGWHHNVYNGRKYLQGVHIQNMESLQHSSIIKKCLMEAIELDYIDTVLVMLSGDVYHCIHLMKDDTFQGEKRFREALDMVMETVADAMSLWGKQLDKNEIKDLLNAGIEIDIGKMKIKDLVDELEYREIKLSKVEKESKEGLVKRLQEELGKKIKVRMRKTVVGALISTLFFNHRNELEGLLIAKKPFKLEISCKDKSTKESEIKKLNSNKDGKKYEQGMVLKSIELLNSSSHFTYNWFFREILEKVVNENFCKIQAVCAAICEGLMKECSRGDKSMDAFDVEFNQIKKTSLEMGHLRLSSFVGENLLKELKDPLLIENEILRISGGLVSGKVPAFSELSRRTIIDLKNKADRTVNEAKDLKENVCRAMEEIKKRIYILADGGDRIDSEYIFEYFKLINSELERKHKREIVELVCRSGNVTLLEMICEQEMKDAEHAAQIRDKHPRIGKLLDKKTPMEEPIEQLLKGVKGHETSKVLKYFGFPLGLYTEKSIAIDPENSTASSKNIPSLQISKADSFGLKTPNKCFLQDNHGQLGESAYNKNSYSNLNALKNSMKVGNEDWYEKLLPSTPLELNELITPYLPEVGHLIEVHCERYKQRLLDKIFDFGNVVSYPSLHQGSSREARISESLYPMSQSQQLDFSHLSSEDLATIESYKKGVGILKLGLEKRGKKEIKKAADKGLPHARYLYALITLKEIAQYNINGKGRLSEKEVNDAFEYMQCIKQEFFPFPSFILGIMQSYNQIFINEKLSDQVTSARQCFIDIVRGITYDGSKYSLVVPRKYIIIEDESDEHLKWIVQSAKYELARDMLSCPEGLSDAKSLLRELSSNDFVDAKCLYALALLKNAFRDVQTFKKDNFVKVCTLLEQAAHSEHKEAMFFFGTLPFRQEFKLLDKEIQIRKGKECFDCLGKYIETCENGEFRRDAAIFIAAEYVKERESYVTYDEEKAKSILKENDCSCELQELEEKLRKRVKNVWR